MAINTDMPPIAQAMIALHATKTFTASKYYKTHSPDGKLIIFLTGTDLYREQKNNNPDFFSALELADILVVSQRASLASIPKLYQHKSRYVPASVLLPREVQVEPPTHPSIALVGHLRSVKNPFLMNQALARLGDLDVHAYTLGAALEPTMLNTVLAWQNRDSRFHWKHNVPYSETISWIRQVDFTLNTSHSEGGSNAVAESIALGTPVLASKVEGNVGMLGDDYVGYFEPNNPRLLADLIECALTDSAFQQEIHAQTIALQEKFLPENETTGWLDLFSYLIDKKQILSAML